jgi:hypothetical protein
LQDNSPPTLSSSRTLQVSLRPGRTALLSLLIFCLALAGSEIALRRIRQPEPYPVYGYVEVENLLHILDNHISENGPLDCILLGSSLASAAINPEVLSLSLQEQAGTQSLASLRNCFVFGLPAATGSSLGAVSHILTHRYHPKLLVLAVHPRAFDGRDSNQLENKFAETPWARYHLGRVDPFGWLLEYSYSARYLQKLPELLSVMISPVTVDEVFQEERPRAVPAHLVDGYYMGLISFHELAPLYSIRSDVPIEQRVITEPYPLSAADFNGLQQVVALQEQEGLKIVVVEIPALETFFDDTSAAPQPTARQAFSDTLGGYVRQQGTPFWITTEYLDIPYPYYADGVHMHLSGALLYSEWLGSQLGAAVRLGLMDEALPEPTLLNPPLPDFVPEKTFLTTYGLSEEEGGQFLARRGTFDLTPADSLIFSPDSTALDPDYELAIIGFFIHWSETINNDNRALYYDLMALRERLVYPEDFEDSSQAAQYLADWRLTHDPAQLVEMGVDYLFYTEQWDHLESAPDAALSDPAQYKQLWHLDFPPLHESYTLYRVE